MSKAMVVDSHHHFWDPTRRDYYWMGGDELAPIRKPMGPEDMRPLLDANGVDRTMIVQTIPSLEETEEFLAIAGDTDFVAGVVGWVDLINPAVDGVLARLLAGPNGAYLKGIRHQVHDEEDKEWVAREDVIRGIKAVGEAGLVYDLLPKEPELPACIKAVDANPNMRFVVDHIAKPRIAMGEMEPWTALMTQMAQRPNVMCKLSGMVTEADWQAWKPADLKPYVEKVLELFGEDRVLFGSDWPVCLLAAEYSGVKGALEEVLGKISGNTRAKIFGGNASKLYKL
jgi:L-fuconolactonase